MRVGPALSGCILRKSARLVSCGAWIQTEAVRCQLLPTPATSPSSPGMGTALPCMRLTPDPALAPLSTPGNAGDSSKGTWPSQVTFPESPELLPTPPYSTACQPLMPTSPALPWAGREGLALRTSDEDNKVRPPASTHYVLGGHGLAGFSRQPRASGTAVPT